MGLSWLENTQTPKQESQGGAKAPLNLHKKHTMKDILAASALVLFPMTFITIVALVAEGVEYFTSKK
jgi:hypothetical protein